MLIEPASKVSVPLPVVILTISKVPDKVTVLFAIDVTVPAVLPDEVATHVFPLKFVQTAVATRLFEAAAVEETVKEPVISLTAIAAALVKAVMFPV